MRVSTRLAIAEARLDWLTKELDRLEKEVRLAKPLPRPELAAALKVLADVARSAL